MNNTCQYVLHKKIKNLLKLFISVLTLTVIFVVMLTATMKDDAINFLFTVIAIALFLFLVRKTVLKINEVIKNEDQAFAELLSCEADRKVLQLEYCKIISKNENGTYHIDGFFNKNDKIVNIKIDAEVIKSETDDLMLEYKELKFDDHRSIFYDGLLYVKDLENIMTEVS